MRFQCEGVWALVLASIVGCGMSEATHTSATAADTARPDAAGDDSAMTIAGTASVPQEHPDQTKAGPAKGVVPLETTVRADMQHVNMHIEPGIVLAISRLRGTVMPTRKGLPPALNDKRSMIINIESGDIAIDTNSLAMLLNRHVFGYAGSPLRNLHVSMDGNEMVQTGVMRKGVWLSFRIRATVALTPDGEIRVHPTAISVAGVGVKGLSRWLGGLSKLIKLEPGHGARIDGEDFVLNPTKMLPPPVIRGMVTSIKLEPGGMRQRFGSAEAARVPLVHRPGSSAKNFMYFHGGTLRFGKLTMSGTDLEIVDADPSNAFDYALDRYQEHLVQGHSNTTPVDGLIVVMPDVRTLKASTVPVRK